MSNLLGEVISASEQVETTAAEVTRDLYSSSTSTQSWSSYFRFTPLGILNIILMLLILSILGINVLGYTDYVVNNYVRPVFNYFGYSLTDITETTIEQSRKGTKFGADVLADTTQATLKNTKSLFAIDKNDININDGINLSSIDDTNNDEPSINFDADDSTSEIQRGRSGGSSNAKNGYCYIGSDRGVRSCVKLSEHQKCMSGDVFPRMDMCLNPKLRY